MFFFKILSVENISPRILKIHFDRKVKGYYIDGSSVDDFVWEAYIFVFKKEGFYCDGIRTKSIINRSFSDINKKLETVYRYPEAGGVMEVLPQTALPWKINEPGAYYAKRQDYSNTGLGMERHYGRRIIQSTPFSSDMTQNYNTGNSSVIYPWVEVCQIQEGDNTDDRKFGSVKYHFYTFDDKLTINGEPDKEVIQKETVKGPFYTPDEGSTWEDISFTRIIDRSNIVGQLKKIEKLDSEGNVVNTLEKYYKFSEELENVHYKDLSASRNFNGDTKPLGLIRETTIRMQGLEDEEEPTYNMYGATQVVYSVPFLVGEKTIQDEVETFTNYAFFNAYTGEAIAKEDKKSGIDGSPSTKLTLIIPYNYITTSEKNELLERKNIYKLNGATFTSETPLGGGVTCVQDILDLNNEIASAGVDFFSKQHFDEYDGFDDPEITIYEQTRFFKTDNYSWKGLNGADAIVFPEIAGSQSEIDQQWVHNFSIDTVDMYARPLAETNAEGEHGTVVYNPYAEAIIAYVNNAHFYEIGIFTCDYDDFLNLDLPTESGSEMSFEDNNFDGTNGWFKQIETDGELRLEYKKGHFGQKCVYVKDTWGPRKKVYVDRNSPYTFSAWINSDDENPVCLSITKKTSSGETIGTPHTKSFTKTSGEWEFIETAIDASFLSDLPVPPAQPGYVEITIGNSSNVEFYMDDIRFYPSDALVKTFYYDYDLKMPVTFVDENNNAQYFEYDAFGRLIEKGVLKSN